ncbi:MAG: FAD-binding oxidoreductase [Candidatus Saccharimonadales bacterium]
MNKVASYLQSHISGDVLAGNKVREYFSRDGSVLTMTPTIVVYPRTTNDIRKVARFAWQLGEKGHAVPITPRGNGTDTSGAAIGKGVIISMPAHMNRILELDTKQRLVRVQPGLNMKSLQETLQTHGLFLPAYPVNYAYSTIGGAIANNAAGEKSQKYGSISKWVDKLEVVLANGEVIQTGKINKKELEKRKGLPTLEGAIYRAVDGLSLEHFDALDKYYEERSGLARDNVGYNLLDCVSKDGSCDLTPLFVGSQGTLGIITEAILKVAPHAPQTDVIIAAFDDMNKMVLAVDEMALLDPSSIEMIDRGLIEFVKKEHDVNILKGVFDDAVGTPAAIVFVEFDDEIARKRSKKAKKADKVISKFATASIHTSDPDQVEAIWAVRASTGVLINHEKGGEAALPIIDDVIVAPRQLEELLGTINELSARHKIDLALWGHVGDANLHVFPLLDLAKLGDRQRVFKLMDEYFKAVIKMKGSVAGANNDGRLRANYSALQLGEEISDVYAELKKACDPHNILNPGVKSGTSLKQLVDMLSHDYSLARLADYLPRS